MRLYQRRGLALYHGVFVCLYVCPRYRRTKPAFLHLQIGLDSKKPALSLRLGYAAEAFPVSLTVSSLEMTLHGSLHV